MTYRDWEIWWDDEGCWALGPLQTLLGPFDTESDAEKAVDGAMRS